MSDNNYLARVEQVVKDNVAVGTVRVLGVVELAVEEREGYWERFYFVAWSNEKEAGTHRVSINSKDEAALFYGNYQLTETDAIHNMIERAGLTPGRS